MYAILSFYHIAHSKDPFNNCMHDTKTTTKTKTKQTKEKQTKTKQDNPIFHLKPRY